MKTIILLMSILLITPLAGKSKINTENNRKLFINNVIYNEIEAKLTVDTIRLFNKEVEFGMSSEDFKSRFNEFKLDLTDGNDINYKFSTNQSNTFKNYWITAIFKNNKLSCLELNGWQTEEYLKLIMTTLKQFMFDKTVSEENEELGTIKSDYYHKDNLKAEYFSFETTALKIYLDN